MNVLELAKAVTLADLESITKGDKPGHAFYGNQHTGGKSSGAPHAQGSGHQAKVTEAVRRAIKQNDIRAGRGGYASMNATQRQLLLNDVAAGRDTK